MISIEDIVAFSGLSRDEVLAIAEHEHIPEVAACALAECLMQQEHGPQRIREMIVADFAFAKERGDQEHAKKLNRVLREFDRAHADSLPLAKRKYDS